MGMSCSPYLWSLRRKHHGCLSAVEGAAVARPMIARDVTLKAVAQILRSQCQGTGCTGKRGHNHCQQHLQHRGVSGVDDTVGET